MRFSRSIIYSLIASLAVALLASVPANAKGGSTTPVSQWATSAAAEDYYSDAFLPQNAAGAPDASDCDGDGLWATEFRSAIASITLTYASAVIPTEINVYQNNVQGAIAEIEVSADNVNWTSIYEGDPTTAVDGSCDPLKQYDDILSVPVTNVDKAISYVRITVDSRTINDWAEIDAVQLVSNSGTTQKQAVSKSKHRSIQFATSTSLLTKKSKAAIKSSVKKAGKKGTYVVTGSAGLIAGVPVKNVRALAKERALVVRSYLIKLGVKKSNITIRIKIVKPGISPKTKLLAKYVLT